MVASTGTGIDFQARVAAGTTEKWNAQTVTLVNPVDLGTNLTYDIEGTNLPIILSRQDFTNRFAATNRHGRARHPNPRPVTIRPILPPVSENLRRLRRTMTRTGCAPVKAASVPALGVPAG